MRIARVFAALLLALAATGVAAQYPGGGGGTRPGGSGTGGKSGLPPLRQPAPEPVPATLADQVQSTAGRDRGRSAHQRVAATPLDDLRRSRAEARRRRRARSRQAALSQGHDRRAIRLRHRQGARSADRHRGHQRRRQAALCGAIAFAARDGRSPHRAPRDSARHERESDVTRADRDGSASSARSRPEPP